MVAAARSTSFCQARSRAVTVSTPSRQSTVVAPSIPLPTAARHAKATFSGVSGALRSTAASAAGMNS
jgi:hypothetical protein